MTNRNKRNIVRPNFKEFLAEAKLNKNITEALKCNSSRSE